MIPKEGPYCTYLSVILVYFVFKISKHYYWLEFSEEFKYNVIEKNMRACNGDLKSFANDSDREDSYKKASDDKTGEEASDDE